MTREKFHEQLERVELELLSMGELAATAVQRAVEGLVEHDAAKAQAVIDEDDPIDDLYLRIDQELLRMLALQSPVASELRLVSAILHSCHHLERIGGRVADEQARFRVAIGRRGCLAQKESDGHLDRVLWPL